MPGLPRGLDKSLSDVEQEPTLKDIAQAVAILARTKEDFFLRGAPGSGTVHPRTTANHERGTLILTANKLRHAVVFTNKSTTVTIWASWWTPKDGDGIYVGPGETFKYWGKLAAQEFRATVATGSTAAYAVEVSVEL